MNVFAFARELETSGQRFYGAMAARARDNGVRNIFGMLAEDEKRIVAELRELEAREGRGATESRILQRGGNVFAGLHLREAQLSVHNDVEAYRLAMMAEREIIDQYREAIEKESDPDVKAVLLRIVALDRLELEELEHLCDFVDAPNRSLEWGEFSNLDEFHNFGRYEG